MHDCPICDVAYPCDMDECEPTDPCEGCVMEAYRKAVDQRDRLVEALRSTAPKRSEGKPCWCFFIRHDHRHWESCASLNALLAEVDHVAGR